VSKQVGRFQKEKEYSEEYAFKTNVYERKKRDKELEERRSKRHEYSDDYDYGYKKKFSR
jgi:hypothetical protein